MHIRTETYTDLHTDSHILSIHANTLSYMLAHRRREKNVKKFYVFRD